eukprot:659164-Amphidinium_carterae.1
MHEAQRTNNWDFSHLDKGGGKGGLDDPPGSKSSSEHESVCSRDIGTVLHAGFKMSMDDAAGSNARKNKVANQELLEKKVASDIVPALSMWQLQQ